MFSFGPPWCLAHHQRAGYGEFSAESLGSSNVPEVCHAPAIILAGEAREFQGGDISMCCRGREKLPVVGRMKPGFAPPPLPPL